MFYAVNMHNSIFYSFISFVFHHTFDANVCLKDKLTCIFISYPILQYETGMWKQSNIFCFRFQLGIKLVASEFASAFSFFFQSASVSTKI